MRQLLTDSRHLISTINSTIIGIWIGKQQYSLRTTEESLCTHLLVN